MAERDVLTHEIAVFIAKSGIALETPRHDFQHAERGAARLC